MPSWVGDSGNRGQGPGLWSLTAVWWHHLLFEMVGWSRAALELGPLAAGPHGGSLCHILSPFRQTPESTPKGGCMAMVGPVVVVVVVAKGCVGGKDLEGPSQPSRSLCPGFGRGR